MKPVSAFTVIGKAPRRKDALDKVTGRARYAADITPPGTLHARILRPPAHGATLKELDTTVRAREEYVNDFERQMDGAANAGATGRVVTLHRHTSELTKYVDDSEHLYDNIGSKTDVVPAETAAPRD